MNHVHTFAGGWFDRQGERRADAQWVQGQRDSLKARFLPLSNLRALMRTAPEFTIAWQDRLSVDPYLEAGAMAVLLGLADGVPYFALDVSAGEGPAFADRGRFIDVRSCAMQGQARDAAVLSQARSLIDWHARHRFCAACGRPTEPRDAGYMRQCGNDGCKAQHFPRTDPVTIMLVFDAAGNVLLGRSHRFVANTYSALAGFVEPGENIEEAVRREVHEETGIVCGRVRYHSSQPWPFPSSLMIGCYADAETSEIRLDGAELEDARWFTRAEIAAMVEAWNDESRLRMPPPLSIAHQLAKGWLRGDLSD
jgi:NAD+ diphosphatase